MRTWKSEKKPDQPFWATHLTLGDRNVALPPDALVSVTYLEDLGTLRGIINGLLSLLVMKQLRTVPGLLFSEIKVTDKGKGYTLTVWESKAMVPFRDQGSHGWAMRFGSWVFFGGKAQAYFLSWLAKGRIPTTAELLPIVKEHGKWYNSGKLMRQASRPDWAGDRVGQPA